MSQLKSLKDFSKIKGKKIFLRVDFNVPISGGRVSDITKIEKLKSNIEKLLDQNCKIILASHLGRPQKNGKSGLSLLPVKNVAEKIFNQKINFLEINKKTKEDIDMSDNQIFMLENLRFDPGEENNSKEYGELLSTFADIYINEAFSCSHRSHASIDAITQFIESFAGPSIIDEVDALEKVFLNSKKPVACLIGGSKISTKIDLIINLMPKMDFMIIGGAMANTFFKEKGFNVGKSLVESNVGDTIKQIYQEANRFQCELILPEDVICSKKFDQPGVNKKLEEVNEDDIILDIGIASTEKIDEIIKKSKTVLWNGPFGLFEYDDFANGTNDISKSIAKYTLNNNLISVAGDALDQSIVTYMRKKFNLLIGESTAEKIKKEIGTCIPTSTDNTYIMKGRDIRTGVPKEITLTEKDSAEAMSPIISQIIQAIKDALEHTPPELSADLVDMGLVLAGGGAYLKNLDKLISKETGLPVSIADDPLSCVAIGTGKALEQEGIFSSMLTEY